MLEPGVDMSDVMIIISSSPQLSVCPQAVPHAVSTLRGHDHLAVMCQADGVSDLMAGGLGVLVFCAQIGRAVDSVLVDYRTESVAPLLVRRVPIDVAVGASKLDTAQPVIHPYYIGLSGPTEVACRV